MGIPSYFSFIIKNYHKTIIHLNQIKKDRGPASIFNLFIDANSIIYDSLGVIDFDDSSYISNIYKQVCKKIDDLIILFNIKGTVVIAFDGVAPLAKLEQQRTRRYKSAFTKSIQNQTSWDTSNITPGTDFMKQLMIYIENYYKTHTYNSKEVILLSSNIEGEGEHKIFQHIRNNYTKYANTTSIVYGLDADLIMLSLIHIHHIDLLLYRETPHFINQINSRFKLDQHYLIDIVVLKTMILAIFNKYYNESNFYNQFHLKTLDYIFICFFLGNDFLPHFPSLNIRTNGIDNLLFAYCNTIRPNQSIITKQLTIDWKLVRKLCYYLYEQEAIHIKDELSIRKKMHDKQSNRKKVLDNLPILDRSIEYGIEIDKKNWQMRYYKLLFDIDYSEENIKTICLNYLQGLEWTFKYYTDRCINWQWKYNYHYPPLFEDLIKYIPYFDIDLVEPNDTKISPEAQLCYVLPKQSFNLINKDIRQKLLTNLDHKYPEDYAFCWAFCKYFWEAHILLPDLSIDEINTVIHS